MKLQRFFYCLAFIGVFLASIGASAVKPQALLIIGNGHEHSEEASRYPNWHHDFHVDLFEEILGESVALTATDDLSILNDEALSRFDLIINQSLFMMPTEAQFDALFKFVHSGKPYFSVHSGLVTFLNSERYTDMVGARYINGEPETELAVQTYDAWWGYQFFNGKKHPALIGIDNFVTHDELYTVDLVTDDLQVIARVDNHPVMWTRNYGEGTVICLTLGHDERAMRNVNFQTLMRSAVRWLLGYPVAQPVANNIFLESNKPVKNYIKLDELVRQVDNVGVTYRMRENSNPDLVRASINRDSGVDLFFKAGNTGRATITIVLKTDQGLSTNFDLTLEVVPKGEGNLALYNGVTAHTSSLEHTIYAAEYLIDNNMNTRWSSLKTDPSWVYVDLGEAYLVDRVRLDWEAAFASEYDIQVSNDAEKWTSVYQVKNGDGKQDELRFKPTKARYVRMLGHKRGTDWSYSLYEFGIFGHVIQ